MSVKDKAQRLRDRILKGRQAETVLDNDVIAEAFDDVEREILEAWKATGPEDTEWLALLKMRHAALNDVKEQLARYKSLGKASQTELDQEK